MQQHPYQPTPVPQIRSTAGAAASYAGVGAAKPPLPATPLKAAPVIAAASRLPLPGGRVTHAAAPSTVPAAVPAAPAPTNTKIQPQLQQLPRFRPPSFEGANGSLPCPDSPGSTPRSRDEDLANLLEGHVATPGREAASPAEKLGPFAVGSIVEYKSRSLGQWILAKVEGFEEANQTYRLDVQPHANPERVRARNGGNVATATPTGQAPAAVTAVGSGAPADQAPTPPEPLPHAGCGLYSSGGAGGRSQATPAAVASAASDFGSRGGLEQPALPQAAALQHVYSATPPRPNATVAEPGSPVSELKELPVRRVTAGTPMSTVDASPNIVEALPLRESIGEAGPMVSQLQMEVEALRCRVSQLEAENEQLHEQVAQEAALKDRYFQELRISNEHLAHLHEQMVRVRGTPR
mmetsp:Transcript_87114/g.244387  ORF Transcript_87114/g.244387 Transcript_87114/m.244387 type:complete len:408 (-) Transcript_87114:165-1388(-)